jgi:hypothetical protein
MWCARLAVARGNRDRRHRRWRHGRPDRQTHGLQPRCRRRGRRGGGRARRQSIGKSLDDEERRQLALASERAAEQPVVPRTPPKNVQRKRTDPKTKTVTASGWVVPKSDPYQRPDGTTCRDVTQSVSKNG